MKVLRSRWLHGFVVICFLAVVVVMLWWRGPDWNVVYHAFDLVNWAWIVFALGRVMGGQVDVAAAEAAAESA